MHFGHVEPAVADQFACPVEHGDLVAEACARRRIGIDVDEFYAEPPRSRQRRQRGQQMLAEFAARAGVEHEAAAGSGSPRRLTVG